MATGESVTICKTNSCRVVARTSSQHNIPVEEELRCKNGCLDFNVQRKETGNMMQKQNRLNFKKRLQFEENQMYDLHILEEISSQVRKIF